MVFCGSLPFFVVESKYAFMEKRLKGKKMKLLRADLHLHTMASDGTWTPEELVLAAKAADLGIIAVTDHESVANVLQTEELSQAAGIKFYRGVEISTTYGNHCYHVLGYGIDVTDKRLLELLNYNTYLLEKKDEDSILVLINKGWPINIDDYHNYTYDRRRGGFKALIYLQDKGLCTGVDDFFKHIFTSDNELCFPEFGTIGETIDIIHNAGGKAFLAHSASDFHGPGLDITLGVLGNEKFDGFECYHSGHNLEDTANLVRYCHEHNKLISGGSDCHGTFVPSRTIGIPEIYENDIKME